jgi:hypothetical protein
MEDAILSYEPSTEVAEARGRIRLEGRKQLSDFFVTREELMRPTSTKHVTVNSIVTASDDQAMAATLIGLIKGAKT